MARIEQSVEIKVPAQVAYNQLTQFEDYPRFMEEVESAEQVDDTHVRWTTKIGQHARDWQSEIVEQTPDRCIAWRNVEGPVSTGRVEVQPLSADSSRVTFTVESEATSAGEAADAMGRQVEGNLQRLKQMIESGGETGAWRGEVHDGEVTLRARDAAGAAGGAAASTQSDNALSDNGDQGGEDGRFNVAEEVNTDQQSDAVRHTGNLPRQRAEGYGDVGTSDALQQALQPDGQKQASEAGLDQAIKRAVPPSN
jgi:hypothetical protein